MNNNIIDLNYYLRKQKRLVENFGMGNRTNIGDKTNINKNYSSNQKIDRSMMVESLSKIVNNVAQDVVQNNSAEAASSAGSLNKVEISGVKCEQDFNLDGITQDAQATNTSETSIKQSNASKVSTEISTQISKTIEKAGATDVGAIMSENAAKLDKFMNDMPGYDPNKAQKLASKCPKTSGLLNSGNKCDVSTEYNLDATVQEALELDESFKITDNDDIENTINTKITQANLASCHSVASATNSLLVADIQAIYCNIRNISQKAVSNVYMKCIMNQENVNEIATKLSTSIEKKYQQIYDAVADKAKKEGKDDQWLADKMELVDTLAAAGADNINAAAAAIDKANAPVPAPTPASTPSTSSTPSSQTPTTSSTPNSQTPSTSSTDSTNSTEPTDSTDSTSPGSTEPNSSDMLKNLNYFYTILIVGIILALLFIYFLIRMFSSKSKKKSDDDDDE